MGKVCSRCGVEKLADGFHIDRTRKNGLKSYCKSCHSAANVISARKSPEKQRTRANAWYAENIEHARSLANARWAKATDEQRARRNKTSADWARQYRSEHREEYREYMRGVMASWRLRHQEKYLKSSRLASTNRRALKRERGIGITERQWTTVVEIFGSVCAYCRGDKRLGIDHFVPLASGGRHELSNFVPACRQCNSSKKDRDPFEWMERAGVDADLVVALICETRRAAA